ncbi:MAG: 23S rRNA (guanosine(2251)-2'-O)-methyltransferase RlmB, partial [Synechococcaceae bacterium WB4_1_0192]|nr:23S rRNA (guanosine(2251)-2'-O)-methyltransferase RlmB [Synechococcaceae bacterium WB4_1_0192]
MPVGEAERFQASPAEDLIWGRHAAQAALESERPIHRIWCTPELRFQPRFLQLLREAKSGGVLVEEVTWARLGQLTDGAVHQGIVLQVAAADTLDLPTLIDGCRNLGEPPLLMALDGITDPHNLGAIVRSAEALGAHGLVLPQRRSAGLTGSVAKVAAGALEHLPVARVVNLNRSLETLKEEGYRVIGLAGEGSVSLSEADLEGPLVIVTGSEGSGLSMLTRKHCDQLVRIPLRGATPSLNASVATAMVLYEVARRGWMKQITGSSPAPRIVRPQLATPPAIERNPTPEPAADEPLALEVFEDEAFNTEAFDTTAFDGIEYTGALTSGLIGHLTMTELLLVMIPVFLVGASFGSFLNVCIARWPLDLSVVSPRSRCPRCERPITWHENIPLLSWLILRGKCAGCALPISLQYPLVEVLVGGLWAAAFYYLGFTLEAVRVATFATLLFGIAV